MQGGALGKWMGDCGQGPWRGSCCNPATKGGEWSEAPGREDGKE